MRFWTPAKILRTLCLAIIATVALYDLFLYDSQIISPDSIAALPDGQYQVIGTVVDTNLEDDRTRLTFDHLTIDDRNLSGRLLVSAPLFPAVSLGDRRSFECKIKAPEPFDGFAYDKFLAAKGIFATCSVYDPPFLIASRQLPAWRLALNDIHEWARSKINQTLVEPHATLFAGLLMGDNDFTESWQNRFRLTGTSHIVAASGYNVALVATLMFGLLIRLGLNRRQTFPFILLAIFSFVILAGGEAAVVRAGIMGGLVLLSKFIGRKTRSLNIILLTIVVMILPSPLILFHDVGFQLSVLSTLGLIYTSNWWSQKLHFIPESFGLRESMACTLAATIFTLPISLFSFGQISLLGPVANLFVLPFLPYILAFGSIATAVSIISPALGAIVSLPAWSLLETVLVVIKSLAEFDWLVVKTVPFVIGAIGFSLVGTGIILVISRLNDRDSITPRRRFAFASPVETPHRGVSTSRRGAGGFARLLAPLVLITLTTVHLAHHAWLGGWVSDRLIAFVFDIGQGDSTYLKGKTSDLLVDGGPDKLVLERLGAIKPWYDRKLDAVLLTHPHTDHFIGLLYILDRYQVDTVYTSGQGYGSSEFAVFESITKSRQQIIAAGDSIQLSNDAKLEILWPPSPYNGQILSDANQGSIVSLLAIGQTGLLLTGDATEIEELKFAPLIPNDLDYRLLKVGHHGSRTSTSATLLDSFPPNAAIISAGTDNSYGHPDPSTVSQLKSTGASIYRTDLLGSVKIDFGNSNPISIGQP